MKIAIDVSPLQSGHKVRGVGFYVKRLQESLVHYFPEHTYFFVNNVSEVSPDVDIIHFPYFDPFHLTLPSRLSSKMIVTVHDLIPIVFPKHFPAGIRGKLTWQRQKNRLRRVDGIITDSLSSKKDIVRLVGITESMVSVVPLAAGEEFRSLKKQDIQIKQVRKKYHLPEKFLLYVGDVTWNKNVPMLISVAQQLDIPLVMVGKALTQKDIDTKNIWNADLVRVQKMVENDPRIIRLGFVATDDLVALYNCATVFVWPSVYEGFGLPILEAMQSGCPVITSRESSMPEVAKESAFYFDKDDSTSLAHAITTVFHDDILRDSLSKKSIANAKQFSWRKTAEQTIHVYEQIMIQYR